MGAELFAVRAGLAEACASLGGCGSSGKPGLAPAGDSLSLASPRESKQREGDPMVWVPPLRCGQPAVLAENGVELELAALRQSLALIRFRLCSSAQPDGWGTKMQIPIRGGENALCASSPEPGPESDSYPPFCMRRGAQGQTDQGSRLFEPKASSSETPAGPSTAGCPAAKRRGRRQQGRLSFAYFSLARQRKVSCRLAIPGMLANQQKFEASSGPTGVNTC